MNFLLLNLFLVVSCFPGPAMHPLHLSVCNVDMSGTESSISVKLFKDDFALVLKNLYQAEVAMEKADEPANSAVISRYINSCLQISGADGRPAVLKYERSEINEDAVWLHFKFAMPFEGEKIRIKNTLMLDLWDDETNLLILTLKGKENGYRFNKDNTVIEADPENQ